MIAYHNAEPGQRPSGVGAVTGERGAPIGSGQRLFGAMSVQKRPPGGRTGAGPFRAGGDLLGLARRG